MSTVIKTKIGEADLNGKLFMKNDEKEVGIGIDLGGTAIKYALATRDGKILKMGQRPTQADSEPEVIMANLNDSIIEMIELAKSTGYLPKVVGVGTPGSVDIERGHLMGSTPNFKNWREYSIADGIKKVVHLPAFVDNDANLMALGETRFGAGSGYDNIICITIGTGVGGGIIIDGKLYRGSKYAGAELGHMSIQADGIPCNCGGKGCLERYASASAMLLNFKNYCLQNNIEIDEKNLNAKYIFELYRTGDRIAEKTVDAWVYFLARGMANFINIFNPEIIIIGGGVAESHALFMDKLIQITMRHAMEKPKENVQIVPAELGNNAGFLGAVSYAFERLQEKI